MKIVNNIVLTFGQRSIAVATLEQRNVFLVTGGTTRGDEQLTWISTSLTNRRRVFLKPIFLIN